ncbi:Uncharacterised protein [Vibrio cholerae]|nr:Uncharacterised protein [Vibrio cholerae]
MVWVSLEFKTTRNAQSDAHFANCANSPKRVKTICSLTVNHSRQIGFLRWRSGYNIKSKKNLVVM